MSYSVGTLAGACPALLTGLAAVTNGALTELNTPVGFVQALVDPSNTQGVDIIQQAGGEEGHLKQVRVVFKQRVLPSEIATTKDCNTGTEKPRLEEVYSIAMERHHTITVKEQTIRLLCDAYSKYLSVPINARSTTGQSVSALQMLGEIVNDWMLDIDPMRQAINQDLLTAATLNTGKYQGGTALKTFDVIKTADHAVVYTGFNIFKQELSRLGMRGQPLMVGEGKMELAIMAANIGCCNTQGQDLGKMATNPGFKFYKDQYLGTAFGNADAFLAFMPGTMQLMSYNRYVGEFARPIGAKVRGTFPDPIIPGLKYDFSIEANTCSEYYDLKIDAYYDLFAAPSNVFKTGDRLAGVNGVVKGIATAQA
ncbi:MAG: hypothetical protein V4714_08230 [Bacteroidota bacterium]